MAFQHAFAPQSLQFAIALFQASVTCFLEDKAASVLCIRQCLHIIDVQLYVPFSTPCKDFIGVQFRHWPFCVQTNAMLEAHAAAGIA